MTPTPAGELRVVEISAVDTHPLRRAVLRNGDPGAVLDFPEDGWPGVFHLGARHADELVGTSSWIPRPEPADTELAHFVASGAHAVVPGAAMQLRGMATADAWRDRGMGVGSMLIEAGCERCASAGSAVVWARARDTALGFYERRGFDIVGDGFVDATTGLAHHLVRRALRPA